MSFYSFRMKARTHACTVTAHIRTRGARLMAQLQEKLTHGATESSRVEISADDASGSVRALQPCGRLYFLPLLSFNKPRLPPSVTEAQCYVHKPTSKQALHWTMSNQAAFCAA